MFFIQGASAAGIGGLLKSDHMSLERGESASAAVLLWGDLQEVSLSAKAPDGFLVLFQPEKIAAGSGTERAASGQGYVAAAPVKVLVKVIDANPGDYVISVVARGVSSDGEISFSPSVALNLMVEVRGVRAQTVSVSPGQDRVIVYGSKPAQEKQGKDGPIALYLAVAVSILAVSCIIYRYA